MEEKKEAVKDFEDEDVEKAIELCEKAIEIVDVLSENKFFKGRF